ncbi:MAG: peptidylprolyl isomerase, partial [Muribaculaceae bacterium]
ITLVALAMAVMSGNAQNNVAEEVAWVVGDEPIFKSEIEEQYMQMQYERTNITGNPYCVIPERIAIEKLFLHQAKIDSIDIPESMVVQQAERRLNFFINNLGSKEKVEEDFRKTMPELREQTMSMVRDQATIQEVQNNLTKGVKPTPSDIRKYFNSLPVDSLPYVPLQVEVQIVSINPVIPQQEIDEVKARLRDYANKVNNGESEFSTLAILYSEDGSSVYGGEIGFMGKTDLFPEYANVAFNLNDTKKVSKIVETDAGFHIIQLIEKRGDRVNTRHILLRPKVSDKDLTDAITRLDSVKSKIDQGKVTFEEAALYVSQDKDSKLNKGIMTNEKTMSPKFEMADLNPEIGKIVDKMEVGDVSEPFVMMNPKTNREMVAIVKLTRRIEGHKAELAEDYQLIKGMYENSQRQKIIADWIKEKQKKTYVRIEEGWRNCEFQYEWGK